MLSARNPDFHSMLYNLPFALCLFNLDMIRIRSEYIDCKDWKAEIISECLLLNLKLKLVVLLCLNQALALSLIQTGQHKFEQTPEYQLLFK